MTAKNINSFRTHLKSKVKPYGRLKQSQITQRGILFKEIRHQHEFNKWFVDFKGQIFNLIEIDGKLYCKNNIEVNIN